MANFNLGRIKGEKGDTGAKGDKGDTGAKGDRGEKGEKGDRGKDGVTPVFSVGNVQTLPHYESAYVEIDGKDCENPILNFGVPSGKDGSDGFGDMQSAIYDTEGKKEDFYLYAQRLGEEYMKKSGGLLSGNVCAAPAGSALRCIRNISVCDTLPETAGEGDICILSQTGTYKSLEECNDGSVVLLQEEGVEKEYVIVGKNNYAPDSVTLVRKMLPQYDEYYDLKSRNVYLLSDIDIFLETVFTGLFNLKTREKLMAVNIDNSPRHCFLMTMEEMDEMDYFVQNGLQAKKENLSENDRYMTRGLNSSNHVYAVTATGTGFLLMQTQKESFRPAIVLPADTPVRNADTENEKRVKLFEEGSGIYVYKNAQWKECLT